MQKVPFVALLPFVITQWFVYGFTEIKNKLLTYSRCKLKAFMMDSVKPGEVLSFPFPNLNSFFAQGIKLGRIVAMDKFWNPILLWNWYAKTELL